MAVLVEGCAESVESALQAAAAGAGRLELCDDLSVGGTTPSLSMVTEVRRRVDLPLFVMIRPRGGDYCYAGDEIDAMLRDIARMKQNGANGVVLGSLHRDGSVDLAATRALTEAARPLGVTFHRAFDRVPDTGEALDHLIRLGIERVLTAGGAASAEAGIPELARLVTRATGRIGVLAGGGVRPENVGRIVRESGVREVHLRYGPWFRAVVAGVKAPAATGSRD